MYSTILVLLGRESTVLSIKCTASNGPARTYEMTDSATGMTCTYQDVSLQNDKMIAWIEANARLLVARVERDLNFTGMIPPKAD